VSIGSAKLRGLTGAARSDALQDLVQRTQRVPNGELADAASIIALYERTHTLTSAEMLRKLDAGELQETWEICQWLLQLRRRDELVRLREAQR